MGVFITGQKLQIDQGFWVFPPDRASPYRLQASLPLLCFTDVAFFLQIEGKAVPQQKDYDLLHCGGLEPDLQYL